MVSKNMSLILVVNDTRVNRIVNFKVFRMGESEEVKELEKMLASKFGELFNLK